MSFELAGAKKQDTGGIYEARFLGRERMSASFKAALESLFRDERGRFRDMNQVFETYKAHYEGDPTDPKGVHAKELRGAIIDELKLPEERLDDVRMYSTIGTPLDRMGFDAFIELWDPESGQVARVTIDVTLRREKVEEGWKADVVIGELPDAVEHAEEYLEEIERLAESIASLLDFRLRKRLRHST